MFGGGKTFGTVVDVYHADTDSWSQESLSAPRAYLAATSVDGKILFAGGESAGADIYDVAAETWSTASFPSARYYPATASVGGYAFFAGGTGNSTEVDVFDASTGLWERLELSQGRGDLAGVSCGDQVYFAGGSRIIESQYYYQNSVDIFTVPEPSTLVLLVVGATGLLGYVSRRRRH